ncbi:serine/threonine-protein phosphatase 6 regulatory ankyrin repeat subunit A-like [Schistocerca cancellata]|uniref:serine/threonine-protein phosphatase 6 regulatory ankyrin repeat subunit A-like n=1 Tax=Schistocerca cancellata TaxID=274614 RepID=UPI002118DA6B|nr:serine/threonine-protein phosphatase 6 regulatory ankyrin repeat subunit A-like [Schistocerca cancellata]
MASRGRPLLTAVLNGSKSEVKSLLEQGADPAEGDVMGRNSFHLGAAYSRDSAALQLLREIVEVARAAWAGGPEPGAAGAPQQAAEAEAVSELGDEVRAAEEGGLVEWGWMSCEAGSVETSSGAAGPTETEEMVATVDPLQHVEAVAVAWGAEDELMQWTPLRYAAERRRWRAVVALLDMGAELHHLGDFQRDQHDPEELWDIFNRYGYSALFRHVLDKKYKSMWSSQTVKKRVEKHLEAGVSVVCAGMSLDQYNKILSEGTIQFNSVPTVSFVGEGMSLEECNKMLYEGAIHFNTEILKLLTFKVVDMKRKSTTVESPALEMHQGASGRSRLDKSRRVPLREERFGNSALQQLTAAGDGVVRVNSVGEATLHEAARRGDCERVRQLIGAGAGVNAQNNRGESAIHLAAKSGNVECIKLLHSAGADVSLRDKKGRTPLHCAAATGRDQCVELLLEAGADALAQDSECCTPLHVAAIRRNADCVRLLANAVENLESADANGFTALHYAARNGDEECLEHLLSAGAHHSPVSDTLNTPLHLAADRGNAECVRQLVQAEADVTVKNADGFTALYLAGRSCSPDCLRHLLKGGADIREKDGFGRTPLHWAVKGGSPACVRVLLDGGADVDERDNNGATALHEAARTARPECVRELVGAKADVAARNADGKTALHLAAQVGYPGSVMDLLEAGADVQAKDDAGRTPLHWATKGGSPACARLLLEAGADTHQRDNNGDTPLQLAFVYSNNEIMKSIWDSVLNVGDRCSSPGQASNE